MTDNEAAEYLLDDIWAELVDEIDVLKRLKVTSLIKKYGEACAEAAIREWKRGIA